MSVERCAGCGSAKVVYHNHLGTPLCCPCAACCPFAEEPRSLMPQWWEWRIVQWWHWRRYKWADRRAFRRECAEIRASRADGDA